MERTLGGTEDDLIRAVVEDPDADAPRLAYADWLQARGRSDRADLIRVQCQAEHLKAREAELLAAHGEEWGKGLAAVGAEDWVFHRGFPEEFHIMPGRLLRSHEEINAITPIRRLQLGWTDDASLYELVDLPLCRQLRSLEIGNPSSDRNDGHFGLAGLHALTASPHFSGLTRLVLHSLDIGAEGAKRVAEAPVLANLTHLTLDDPRFKVGNKSMHRLIASPHLANLRELKMGGDIDIGPFMLRRWREWLDAGRSEGQSP